MISSSLLQTERQLFHHSKTLRKTHTSTLLHRLFLVCTSERLTKQQQKTVVLRLKLRLWPHHRQSVQTSTSFSSISPFHFGLTLTLPLLSTLIAHSLSLLITTATAATAIFPRGYRPSVLGTPYDNHPSAAHNSTASSSIQTTYSHLFSFSSRLGHLFGSVVTLRFNCHLFSATLRTVVISVQLFPALWLTFDSHFTFIHTSSQCVHGWAYAAAIIGPLRHEHFTVPLRLRFSDYALLTD